MWVMLRVPITAQRSRWFWKVWYIYPSDCIDGLFPSFKSKETLLQNLWHTEYMCFHSLGRKCNLNMEMWKDSCYRMWLLKMIILQNRETILISFLLLETYRLCSYMQNNPDFGSSYSCKVHLKWMRNGLFSVCEHSHSDFISLCITSYL